VPTDLELIDAWREGDQHAGSELFERHFDSICRFFANKVDRDVDDLVQRTFMACVEGRERFRQESSFRTYLFGVARNVLRAYLRKRNRDRERIEVGVTSVAELGLDPGLLLAEREEQTLILQALRRVPLEHQIVLELYYWENLAARELAEILECPEGTIRGRIRRAKQLLMQQLEQLSSSDAILKSTVTGLETWAKSLRDKVGQGRS
jgi:RNA polymerase sigma-70 factor (ECF subfamily)